MLIAKFNAKFILKKCKICKSKFKFRIITGLRYV